jgi:hypothetical protein
MNLSEVQKFLLPDVTSFIEPFNDYKLFPIML